MTESTCTSIDDVARQVQSPQHEEALLRLFLRVGQLSSLPVVAQRLLQVAGNSDASTADLLAVIEQDPTLSIRILRTVNSSYFGLSHQVADLKTALSMLGLVAVRNLVLTVYVARLCEEPTEYRGFSREKLWCHLVTVGTIARLLAHHCGKVDPDEAYLSGLLHDVGILLVDQYMRPSLCQVLDLVHTGMSGIDAERQVLTFAHTDLGAFVARQSNFPDRVVRAIAYHHSAELYLGPERELLDVIVLANYVAGQNDITAWGTPNLETPPPRSWHTLEMDLAQLEELSEEIDAAITSAQVLATI